MSMRNRSRNRQRKKQQHQLLLLLLLLMLMLLLLHAWARMVEKDSCERSKRKNKSGTIEPKVGYEKEQKEGGFWRNLAQFLDLLLRICCGISV